MFAWELFNSLPSFPYGFHSFGLTSAEFGANLRRLSTEQSAATSGSVGVGFGWAGVFLALHAFVAAIPQIFTALNTHGAALSGWGDLIGFGWTRMSDFGHTFWTGVRNWCRPRPFVRPPLQIMRVFEFQYDPFFRAPYQVMANTTRRWVLGSNFEMLPTPRCLEGYRNRYLDRISGAYYGQHIGFQPIVDEFLLNNAYNQYIHLHFIRCCDWYDPVVWQAIREPVSQVLEEELPEYCHEHYNVMERRRADAERVALLADIKEIGKRRLI